MFLVKLNSSVELIFFSSFPMFKEEQKSLGFDPKHQLLTCCSQEYVIAMLLEIHIFRLYLESYDYIFKRIIINFRFLIWSLSHK